MTLSPARVTGVRLPTGGRWKFRLDAEGETVAFVDAAGGETRYQLNPYGEALVEIDPLGAPHRNRIRCPWPGDLHS